MRTHDLGYGHAKDFFALEFQDLTFKDKRLFKRAQIIFEALQTTLTTCVRRLFLDKNEARQAYDFFWIP